MHNPLSEISDDTDGISDMSTSVHTDVSNRESHDRADRSGTQMRMNNYS